MKSEIFWLRVLWDATPCSLGITSQKKRQSKQRVNQLISLLRKVQASYELVLLLSDSQAPYRLLPKNICFLLFTLYFLKLK